MAANYKAGTITSPTSTGNAAFTGIGFAPTALIMFFEKQTTLGTGTDFLHGVGFGTSSSSRAAVSSVYLTGIAGGTVNEARAHSAGAIIYAYNTTTAAASAFLVADLVSMDSDGFTLNFTTVQATGYLVSYIALGGADLSNVFIKQLQCPGSTGTAAYTGVGFKPDALIAISCSESTAPPTNSFNVGARAMFGFGNATTSKATAATGDDTAGKKTGKGQKTNLMLTIDAVATAVLFEATITSLDSDGFTLNWATISANRYCWVLCLKGGQYAVGAFNQSTSTGNQSVSGLSFQPLGVMLGSANVASTTVISTGAKMSLGSASSSSSRWTTWLGASGDPSVVNHDHDNAEVFNTYTETVPTLNTQADYVSNDSGGFTINNTTADSTSREIIYMAFGSNAAVVGTVMNLRRMRMGVGM